MHIGMQGERERERVVEQSVCTAGRREEQD